MMTREKILERAITAAVEAGNLLMRHYADEKVAAQKESLRDLVTEIDRIAEDAAIAVLRSGEPRFPILTEEHGLLDSAGDSFPNSYWVVDALDGTVNYVNQIPLFCVTIAWVQDGQPRVGVTYNPMSNDIYYGAEGMGVFKNQRNLKRAQGSPSFEECLFAAAFSGKSFDPATRQLEYQIFGEVNDQSRGCLRTGSAAMNLAYVAEARLGGCWGRANKFWDIAAGLVLAQLSGAKVKWRVLDPKKHLVSYIATTPGAWEKAYGKLERVLGLS